ncbi:MAG TPA: NfeD family protein [Limnobacter sp.]|uniref:NfeD family protein n=1 Tax=Limnobacter sp. TaxID=2003368 RepID=UPI002ED800E2
MGEVSFWLVFGGALLIAEMTTGTFYLLMVALGALLGAGVAYMGYPVPLQIAAAGVFAAAATLALKNSRKNDSAAQTDNQSLDIGNPVSVESWQQGGRATVQYRGSQWAAESVDAAPTPGEHRIVAVQGSVLKLQKSPQA